MDGRPKTAATYALVSLAVVAVIVLATMVLAIVISSHVHGADFPTQCSSSRGGRDHWAWREIDGRRCWYLGKRGRAKESLSWGKPRQPRQMAEVVVAFPPPEPPPATPMYESWPTPPALDPEELRDSWLANNCCWPPLEELAGDTSNMPSFTKGLLLTIFPVVVLTALYAATMLYPMKGFP